MRYTVDMLNKIMMRNGGCLDLNGFTELIQLPGNLTVGGWIYCDGRKFKRGHDD